ncbi:DoxX family protein [SAR92 clade bacterium H455]|uniref:DoxX family protein n=1 Tax=SAR92 clade bacterium H455 TaxID=2974818 RepID=A0ABY5TIV6_9GAMM|nr:DoxX family protein [SAR92 clade bacterium H455]
MTEKAVQPLRPLHWAIDSMQLPRSWVKRFFLFLLSAFFTYAGFHHLLAPDFYVSIMPPWIPGHLALVYISGVFEIMGGIGVLIPRFRALAGIGLVALLIAVYPANLYMAFNPELFPDIPVVALYVRLALQFVAFYWAYSVTRPDSAAAD